MTNFKKLRQFFSSRKKQIERTDDSQNRLSAPEFSEKVLKDLFVDNQEPLQEETKNQSRTREQTVMGPLGKFLHRNFEQMGYDDGYKFHNAEFVLKRIREIKADFRLAVDMEIGKRYEEIYDLKMSIRELENIDPNVTERIAFKIEILEHICARLKKEKAFSVEDDGLVMNAIRRYETNYSIGVNDWMRESKLLGSSPASIV